MKLIGRVKKIWVSALRSGDFIQGNGKLCTQTIASSEPEFCCLGVLQDIENDSHWYSKMEEYYGEYNVDGERIVWQTGPVLEFDFYDESDQDVELDNEFRESIGLSFKDANHLAMMNDRGDTFEEIADFIEEKL